jgi:uncharacterized protein (TIGR03435 family)
LNDARVRALVPIVGPRPVGERRVDAFLTVLRVVGLVSAIGTAGFGPSAQSLSPAFEVASVKPTNVSGTALVMLYPGGRLRATNFSLQGLISRAWHLQGDQVEGGPNWIRSEGFDIEAKAEGNPPAEQIWLMLRTLLAERFALRVRTETREFPVYELVVARNDGALGPTLRTASGTNCISANPSGLPLAPFDINRPPCGALYSPVGRWTGRGVPIASLVSALARVAGRVVIDRTRLNGRFDVDLQWTDVAVLLQPDSGLLEAPSGDGPSLFTALREQLGLKLEARRGPVEVLVVEHAERPTSN